MEPLTRVLQGREERVVLQARMLSQGFTVVQASLNVPGFPKRLVGDVACLDRTILLIRKEMRSAGPIVAREVGILNGAGYAVLLGVRGVDRPEVLKRRCISIEETLSWGRVLDLDVLVPAGSVSRECVGEAPRLCPLCGDEAKACGREGRHDRSELRRFMGRLITECLQEGESSSFFP
jgi:holo-ACP synthase CitX